MKFLSCAFAAGLSLLAMTNRLIAADANAVVRIMPLGDSTTAGSYGAGRNGIGGYRKELARQLSIAKAPINFVGSLNDPAGAGFDANHEGHRAWRIDQVSANVAEWLHAAAPDIVLVQIGINDLIQGATIDEAVQRYEHLIDRCHAARPSAKFYFAALLSVRPSNDYRVSPAAVQEFNARLPGLVTQHVQQGMRAEFVNLASLCAFETADFSSDGLHPSEQGYNKIAAVWFRIIRADLP